MEGKGAGAAERCGLSSGRRGQAQRQPELLARLGRDPAGQRSRTCSRNYADCAAKNTEAQLREAVRLFVCVCFSDGWLNKDERIALNRLPPVPASWAVSGLS